MNNDLDRDGTGEQTHRVYHHGEHPCCKCQACEEIERLRAELEQSNVNEDEMWEED